VRAGELDHLIIPSQPRDVLAQQIVAETAREEWGEDALFELVRGAYPYRDLERAEFDEIVAMVSTGFSTQRGRRGALVHHDAVNGRAARPEGRAAHRAHVRRRDPRDRGLPRRARARGRSSARSTKTSPSRAWPATSSSSATRPGASSGSRRASCASRTRTGSRRRSRSGWARTGAERRAVVGVSRLREEVGAQDDRERAAEWLIGQDGIPASAAFQIADYLHETKRVLGVVPTQRTIVLERFFDEAGGMQLVVHSPFGSRVNRAWGLALRKKFCLNFSFELQAAATEEGIVLSLGPQQSFPLEDVFGYLSRPRSSRLSSRRCWTRRSSRRAGAGTRRCRSPSDATTAARGSPLRSSGCRRPIC
jgi:ATP-dependent Lhr-like helicase